MIVGIDASRNRSGGAQAHLIGILSEGDPLKYGIQEVHVWSYQALLDVLPDRPWLTRHHPKPLEQSLLQQVIWQRWSLPKEARRLGCSIVLNTDAGTVSRFRPAVTMSRDMLSYEPGEIQRFGFGRARLRLALLRHVQNRSLRGSDGVIFLTSHAARVIQSSCGPLSRVALIPHGVAPAFKRQEPRPWPGKNESPVLCLYVSNTDMYKHQWTVVRAIARLRQRAYNVQLVLAGGGGGRARRLLDAEIALSDPAGRFVRCEGFVPPARLPELLGRAHLFIFASSCENMPNTLVEAMAVGLPIACSNRGPMPEVLRDGGYYFDPEDAESIASSVARIIDDERLRVSIAGRAKALSEDYSWSRCADQTWEFLAGCSVP